MKDNKYESMSYSERLRVFEGVPVTLDGEPAEVVGYRLGFAVVRTLSGDKPHCQWAWRTAERIVNAGGDFRS